MMSTKGSFVSFKLTKRPSLITIPRLKTTFVKNVLNTLVTSLLRKIISSFWIRVILLQLLEILFVMKGYKVFQKFLLPSMFLASNLFFSFRKRQIQ